MKKTGAILLILIVLVLSSLQTCQYFSKIKNKQVSDTTQTIHVDTTYTVIKDSLVYVPKPYPVHDTVVMPAKFDTLATLREYYTKHFLPDTLANDSALFVAIYDTLYNNQVISRKKVIERHYPVITKTITNNITITQPNKGFYFGGGAGYQNGLIFDAGLSFINNNQLFSFDITTNKAVILTYKRKF